MSKRKILPTYEFQFPEDLVQGDIGKVRVQAAIWSGLNTHPHDGGICRIVKPYLKANGEKPDGVCEKCNQLMENHGLIPTREEDKISLKDVGHLVCPGNWILFQNNDYWPCDQDLFEELYKPLPKRDWYAI